ncbi:hypothetical protein [Salinimonas sediminis]|uniref:Uncharacterized protein n=1 Tax=Salinimonas sediminis TaxID=2303538 RepID=A0A346NNC0_9ALTE|nr:hypothetical protein [Salinimonas sediminis]AXR07027.1 hypothetical protein D0Y50_12110 [Salinimonas sediminis]
MLIAFYGYLTIAAVIIWLTVWPTSSSARWPAPLPPEPPVSLASSRGRATRLSDWSWGLLIALLWPIALIALALYYLVLLWQLKRWGPAYTVSAEQTSVSYHQGTHLTIDEIEPRHYFFDPLDSIPPQPFGLLYPKWQIFKAKYSATPLVPYSQITRAPTYLQIIKGYAVINQANQMVDCFMYEVEERPVV